MPTPEPLPLLQPETPRWTGRIWILVGLAGIGTLAAFLLPPVAQPQSYHRFADTRTLFGVPNAMDVLSNAPFVAIGVVGLMRLRKAQVGAGRTFRETAERWPYVALFASLLLTGFGSGWYHWAPSNASLLWDRLPLAMCFTGILAVLISERLSAEWGLRLLAPLLLVAMGSAAYWRWSELYGTENVVPYIVVQVLSLVLVALLAIWFPARYTHQGHLFFALGAYGLAKAAESLDHSVFALGHAVSGHTLKHLLAALAMAALVRMLALRKAL